MTRCWKGLFGLACLLAPGAAHAQSTGDSTHIAEALGTYILGTKGWPLDSAKWYGEARAMESSFLQAVRRQMHVEDDQMLPFCSDRGAGKPQTAWFAMSILKWQVDSALVLVTRDGGRAGGCSGQVGQEFFLRLTPDGWKVDRVGLARRSPTPTGSD